MQGASVPAHDTADAATYLDAREVAMTQNILLAPAVVICAILGSGSVSAADEEKAALFDAIKKKDIAAVDALLAKDPALAGARNAKGASAVLAAAFRIENDGFTPPAQNELLQRILAKKPT